MKKPHVSCHVLQRVSEVPANPQTIIQKATGAAGLLNHRGKTASLLLVRDEVGTQGFVLTPRNAKTDQGVMTLAEALGASATLCDPPDLSATSECSRLVYRSFDDTRSGLIQSGADYAEVARTLAPAMSDGSWVCATFRSPSSTFRELSRWGTWLTGRIGTQGQHPTRQCSPVVAEIIAGSIEPGQSSEVLAMLSRIMPGFDMSTRTQTPTRRGFLFAWAFVSFLLGIVAWLPRLLAHFGEMSLHESLPQEVLWAWEMLAKPITGLLVVIFLIVFLLVRIGAPVCLANRLYRRAARLSFPSPPCRMLKPAPPVKKEGVIDVDGRALAAPGQYPLKAQTFMVGTHQVAAMIAPQAGALSGATGSMARAVPPELLSTQGQLVGSAPGGLVRLSWPDTAKGVGVFGVPGSGKSVLMQHLFASDMRDKSVPCGLPGAPGASNSAVVFEVKSDSAQEYVEWGAATGQYVMRVDLASPQSHQIDFFTGVVPRENLGQLVTDSLAYAFGGQEWTESKQTLNAVFAGALCLTPEDIGMAIATSGLPAHMLDPDRSFMYYAHLMLGGGADKQVGRVLMEQVERKASTDTLARAAWDRLAPFYAMTPAQFLSKASAPSNKIDALLGVDHVFKPALNTVSHDGTPVQHLTWDYLIRSHANVVLSSGAAHGFVLNETAEKTLSALALYTLREYVKGHCATWESHNKWVSVYVDEVSEVANKNPEVFMWFREKGRSSGVRLVAATQRPETLDTQIRSSMMALPTLCVMKQDSKSSLELAQDLGADGSGWSVSDLVNLPYYRAIVRTDVEGRRQPAFALDCAYYSKNKTAFFEVR